MNRPCLGVNGTCPYRALTPNTRCPRCTAAESRRRESQRPSAAERGYDAAHVRARRLLGARLPGPCGYCARVIEPSERWVAAHVRDGDPTYGWVAAHPACNVRARAVR